MQPLGRHPHIQGLWISLAGTLVDIVTINHFEKEARRQVPCSSYARALPLDPAVSKSYRFVFELHARPPMRASTVGRDAVAGNERMYTLRARV